AIPARNQSGNEPLRCPRATVADENMKPAFVFPAQNSSGKNLAALFIALALFVSPAWSAVNGAAIPPPEKLLPDDTLIMVTAPDFARLRQIWNPSPQTRLWNDPAMKPFKDKFLARLNEELLQPLERD